MLHCCSLSHSEDTGNFGHTQTNSVCFTYEVLQSNVQMNAEIKQSEEFIKNFPESILGFMRAPAGNLY